MNEKKKKKKKKKKKERKKSNQKHNGEYSLLKGEFSLLLTSALFQKGIKDLIQIASLGNVPIYLNRKAEFMGSTKV